MNIKEIERRMKISKSLKEYYATDKGMTQRMNRSKEQKNKMNNLYKKIKIND